ncbi:MAG: hypothetical protein AB9834_12690 [Lentimicrobium sp.]
MRKNQTWKSNSWVIGIGTSLIASIIYAKIQSVISGQSFFSTVWHWITLLYEFVLRFFNIEIKLWVILLTLLIIFLVSKIVRTSRGVKEQVGFDFKNYKTDYLQGFQWNWGWEFNLLYNKYVVSAITPECTECNTNLLVNHYGYYYCPRCKKEYWSLKNDILVDIEALIIDNLNRKLKKFEGDNAKG